MRGFLLRVVPSLATAWLLACSTGQPAGITKRCVPGQVVSCPCLDGTTGVQTCQADRTFDACGCGGHGGSGGTGGGGGTGGIGGTGGSGGTGPVKTFACTPIDLDFGAVFRGLRKTLDVACTNLTGAAAELIVEPIAGPDREQFRHPYAANGGRVSVPGGQTLTIPVEFHANRLGEASAHLEILAAPQERVSRVRLQGVTIEHAINCTPGTLDFGFVAPGTSVRKSIVCTNLSSDPHAITQVALGDASDNRFTWSPAAYPLSIPASGTVTLDVWFSPVAADAGTRKNGVLRISTSDPTRPASEVQLTGFSGGPALTCTPRELDFGPVVKGFPASRAVVCANTGAGAALLVSALATSNPEYTATVRGGLRPAGYEVGQTFTLDVTYDPVDDGSDTATLTFASNAINPAYAVALSGEGRALPPCDLNVYPQSLRFGYVERGKSATLEVGLRNRRTDAECAVRNLALAANCDPGFSLPGGEIALDTIPPGGELRVPVTFAPTRYGGGQTCELHFEVSNPAQPDRVVPILGASMPACLLFEPDHLDFGTVEPGCRSLGREVHIVNTCTTPMVVELIEPAPSPGDAFLVLEAPAPGATIAPGESLPFTLAHAPLEVGTNTGAAFVHVRGAPDPYMVTARGASSLAPIQVDTFVQLDRAKVDVLWVIDNSGSMTEEQQAIAGNVGPFLSFAQAQQIDYHVGVTTTGLTAASAPGCPGGVNGGEDGRLVPVDNSRPRVLVPSLASHESLWAANFQVGTCHDDEQGAEAAYRALHAPVIDSCDDPRHPEAMDGNCGFLRPDAHLSIVFLTDDADGSPQPMNFYANAFKALKGPRSGYLVNVHVVTGDPGTGCGNGAAAAGDRLISLAQQTEGGTFRSICTSDWAQTFRELSVAVFGFDTCFLLANRPADANGDGTISDTQGELEVRLNGTVQGSTGAGGQPVWRYRADRNAVCFLPHAVPAPWTQVDVRYAPTCF